MLIAHLNQQLLEREAQGLRRVRRVAETPCSAHPTLSVDQQPPRQLLAFASNDYLGLASHPVVNEALIEGVCLYGSGSGASALVTGHTRAHQALEDELARWFAPHIPGAQVLSFGTGFMANLALLTALGDANASIFADKLNHASLIDGGLLAKAPMQRYAHGNLAVLERQLQACATPVKLIVVDGVFSMDGDLADLPALLALAERYDAFVIVDDAHGFGTLGPQGQGSLAHFGLYSERLITMGTLGKAAGVGGAFVAAHPTVIEWLIQAARPYIYTTAPPPALAHALLASLHLIQSEEGAQRRLQLELLIDQLRGELSELIAAHPQLGWQLCDSPTAIQPLIVGDNHTTLRLAAALDAQGLWVPAIRPPTVPVGTARLRITLSADHTAEDVQRLTHALAQCAQELA